MTRVNEDYEKNIQEDFMLTTKDNPYDPYTQWDEWFQFDRQKGYNSMSYLARIATVSSDMSDEWNDLQVKDGIREIVRVDPFDIYRIIHKNGTVEKAA